MRVLQRLAKNESGVTMGLTVIMIVLLGVMGAGLLTFVSRDLNTVVEVNQGQRAFEMADAGVQAAKRQLTSDCGSNTSCQNNYNDTSATSVIGEDNRWSQARGGLTLSDLNGDGNPLDNVNVQIKATGTYDFTVTSTGYYGPAKRRIEAKLKGITGIGGTSNDIINPGYYTPSDIMIEGTFTATGVSLFSEKNIIIKGLSPKTREGFQDDASTNSQGVLRGANSKDPLHDWYSPELTPPDNWNLVRRLKEQPSTQSFDTVGFAAEGKVCSPTVTTSNTCISADPSVADGVYGYDSTTGNTADLALTAPDLHSNLKKFEAKDPPCTLTACPTPTSTQNPNTISYPFPRVRPDPARLKQLAETNPGGNKYWACPSPAPSVCSPPWSTTLFPPSARDDQVVFVNARGNTLNLDIGNNSTGILVVWCGNFTLSSPFKGIIVNLYGDSTAFPGASGCDSSKGIFSLATASNENVQAWVYANGGTGSPTVPGTPGITFKNDSELKAVPGGGDLANIAFGSSIAPPDRFEIQGWRELYQ